MLSFIDHVTVAVRDVESTSRQLRERFPSVMGKVRVDEAAGVATSVMPLLQGYLELMAPVESANVKSSPVHRRLKAFLEAREGLFSFALRSSDVRSDVERLGRSGSRLEQATFHHGNEGGPDVGWWTAFVDGGETYEPFLIQPDAETEGQMRRAGATQPMGIRSIEEVALLIPDVEMAATVFERDYGLTVDRRMGRQAKIGLGGSGIMLVPCSAAPLGTPVGLVTVSLGTTNITGVRAELRNRGTRLEEAPFSWGVASLIEPAEASIPGLCIVQL